MEVYHKGKVEQVESPAKVDSTSEDFSEDDAPAPAPVIKARILVVEDDPMSQIVAKISLEDRGYEVDVVETGDQTLTRYTHYDLILLDIGLPNSISGLEICQLIRSRERRKGKGRRMPIVAHTTYGEDMILDECKAAGIDELTTKPVNMDKLDEIIEHHLAVAGTAA